MKEEEEEDTNKGTFININMINIYIYDKYLPARWLAKKCRVQCAS